MTNPQLALILGALGVLLSAIPLGSVAVGVTGFFLVGLLIGELAHRGGRYDRVCQKRFLRPFDACPADDDLKHDPAPPITTPIAPRRKSSSRTPSEIYTTPSAGNVSTPVKGEPGKPWPPARDEQAEDGVAQAMSEEEPE